MFSLKKITVLALCFIALSFSVAQAKVKVGDKFPMKKLKEMSGKGDRAIASLVKGHSATIVDFWASWCGPCGEAMPALNVLHSKYKNKVQVIGVNVDDKLGTPEIKALTDKVQFPLVHDSGKKLATEVGVQTMPSSFILDSAGKVKYIHKGFRSGDEKEIEKQITALLK